MLLIVEIFAHGTRACLACIFDDMAADDLALQGVRAWEAAMVQFFFYLGEVVRT